MRKKQALLEAVLGLAPVQTKRHHYLLFPSLVPMGWEDCQFLQPADFLAYENFKEDERHMTGRNRRYPLTKLLGGEVWGGKAGCFDETSISSLRDQMSEELKAQLLTEANLRLGKGV